MEKRERDKKITSLEFPSHRLMYIRHFRKDRKIGQIHVTLTQDLRNYIRISMSTKIWILIAKYSVEGISLITSMTIAV